MSQKLTFTTTSVLSTVVSNETDTIYYDIQTPEWEPHLTTVRRLNRQTGKYEVRAVISGEPNKPIEVKLYDGAFEPEGQWIKKIDGTTPEENRWQFDDGEGKRFAWKITNTKSELRSAEADKTAIPLATFYQHKRWLMYMTSEPAYLDVSDSAIGSLDGIIVSLLTIERKRRAKTLV